MSQIELAEGQFVIRNGDVLEDEFPESAPLVEQLRFMLKYAVLAPSSHNTQPWFFLLNDDSVDLYADKSRALPVVDPENRELIISCGAVLFYLCVALRHFGYEYEVARYPNPENTEFLARVTPGRRLVPSEEEECLFYAILQRRTNRMPFFKRNVEQTVLRSVADAVDEEFSWLHIVGTKDDRDTLAALISDADRIQWSDRRFRRELAAWLHPNRSLSHDGLPGYSMGMGDLMSVAGPVVVRTFDLGNGQAARDRDLAEGSPVLAVLGTPGDTDLDWLRAGESLAHVLLCATAEGLSASFLNQPVEVQSIREILHHIIGRGGYPQIVLRMGYGPEAPMTARRPVSEVVA